MGDISLPTPLTSGQVTFCMLNSYPSEKIPGVNPDITFITYSPDRKICTIIMVKVTSYQANTGENQVCFLNFFLATAVRTRAPVPRTSQVVI